MENEKMNDGSANAREMTFGEKLVGLDFNPSNLDDVTRTKQMCANLADMVMSIQRETTDAYLSNTLKGDAIRQILHAQMAVVKYLTLKY